MVIQNFYLRLAKLSRDSIQRFQRFFNREETPTANYCAKFLPIVVFFLRLLKYILYCNPQHTVIKLEINHFFFFLLFENTLLLKNTALSMGFTHF